MPTVALAMTFETTLLLPLEPAPVPISHLWVPIANILVIEFDQAVNVTGFDAGNWFLRRSNQSRLATSIVPDPPNSIQVHSTIIGSDIGSDEGTYSPPPNNIEGLTGVPVGSFTV